MPNENEKSKKDGKRSAHEIAKDCRAQAYFFLKQAMFYVDLAGYYENQVNQNESDDDGSNPPQPPPPPPFP